MKLQFTVDEYGKDILTDASNIHQVMMEWEKPYMEQCIQTIRPEGHVLEIGFGFGYSAQELVKSPDVKSYTVIESSPVVWEKFEDFKQKNSNISINLIRGRWQDVIHDLGKFDTMFFDDYDSNGNMQRFREFMEIVLQNHTKIGSRIGVYSTIPWSCVTYGCINEKSYKYPIEIPPNCKYARGDCMYLLVHTKVKEWEILSPVHQSSRVPRVPRKEVQSRELIVVDNFYNNSKQTMDYINTCDFGDFGYTKTLWDASIQPDFERELGERITSMGVLNGRWFRDKKFSAPRVLNSGSKWVGVLFYNNLEPEGSGIQLFERKIKGDPDDILSTFIKRDFIYGKFNRLVLFRGDINHMIIDNGLTQRFYFN